MIINIVTPCSRPENLIEMSKSINIPDERYRWIVVFDAEAVPDIDLPKNVIALAVKDKDGISGNPQRNYAIDFIASNPIHKDEYLLFFDDDTILHPNFWESVKDCEEDIVSWKQSWADGSHRLYAGEYSIGAIDSGSFMVKRSIIGDLKWQKEKYDADGYFAEQIITKAKTNKEIDKYLSYYNYLRK